MELAHRQRQVAQVENGLDFIMVHAIVHTYMFAEAELRWGVCGGYVTRGLRSS